MKRSPVVDKITIRQARHLNKQVQGDIARLLNINQSLVSFIESGMALVPPKDRTRWAWALNTPAEQIDWGDAR